MSGNSFEFKSKKTGNLSVTSSSSSTSSTLVSYPLDSLMTAVPDHGLSMQDRCKDEVGCWTHKCKSWHPFGRAAERTFTTFEVGILLQREALSASTLESKSKLSENVGPEFLLVRHRWTKDGFEQLYNRVQRLGELDEGELFGTFYQMTVNEVELWIDADTQQEKFDFLFGEKSSSNDIPSKWKVLNNQYYSLKHVRHNLRSISAFAKKWVSYLQYHISESQSTLDKYNQARLKWIFPKGVVEKSTSASQKGTVVIDRERSHGEEIDPGHLVNILFSNTELVLPENVWKMAIQTRTFDASLQLTYFLVDVEHHRAFFDGRVKESANPKGLLALHNKLYNPLHSKWTLKGEARRQEIVEVQWFSLSDIYQQKLVDSWHLNAFKLVVPGFEFQYKLDYCFCGQETSPDSNQAKLSNDLSFECRHNLYCGCLLKWAETKRLLVDCPQCLHRVNIDWKGKESQDSTYMVLFKQQFLTQRLAASNTADRNLSQSITSDDNDSKDQLPEVLNQWFVILNDSFISTTIHPNVLKNLHKIEGVVCTSISSSDMYHIIVDTKDARLSASNIIRLISMSLSIDHLPVQFMTVRFHQNWQHAEVEVELVSLPK